MRTSNQLRFFLDVFSSIRTDSSSAPVDVWETNRLCYFQSTFDWKRLFLFVGHSCDQSEVIIIKRPLQSRDASKYGIHINILLNYTRTVFTWNAMQFIISLLKATLTSSWSWSSLCYQTVQINCCFLILFVTSRLRETGKKRVYLAAKSCGPAFNIEME